MKNYFIHGYVDTDHAKSVCVYETTITTHDEEGEGDSNSNENRESLQQLTVTT